MQRNSWQPTTATGDGLEMAERHLAEAKALRDPIAAIDRFLQVVDLLQRHIGRMDTHSEFARRSMQRARLPEGSGFATQGRVTAAQ